MTTVTLLCLLFVTPARAAEIQAAPTRTLQESSAAEGSTIESTDVSGLSWNQLSPGLRRDIQALTGTPLSRARLEEIRSRIEGERPEVVAAVRSVARPDGKATVVFLVARISDDPALQSDINARYVVESVSIEGVRTSVISQGLRDDLQSLVGARLDPGRAEELARRLSSELDERRVLRRVSRGSQPGQVRVVFDVGVPTWIPLSNAPAKLVYHSDLGWSGAIGLGASSNRVFMGVHFVFDDKDGLVETYRGYTIRVEGRDFGTHRLGASVAFSSFRQTWDDATVAVLTQPGSPETYRKRQTIEPALTFAFDPRLRVKAGVSTSELDDLSRSSGQLMANAAFVSLVYDDRWRPDSGGTGRARVGYLLRAGMDALGSDLVYKRHLAEVRYDFRRRHNRVIVAASFGHITGSAPLFERFTLGDSVTLRGWNKHDIAPAGGESMDHQSVEYRNRAVAFFLDAGAVWSHNVDRKQRLSAGFGFHRDNVFATVAFPLNANKASATFIAGIRF